MVPREWLMFLVFLPVKQGIDSLVRPPSPSIFATYERSIGIIDVVQL
jgi:hypothetical protein